MRQADSLFAPEDPPLANQIADGQRDADDDRGDVERRQDLDGFMRVAARSRRAGSGRNAGNQQRQSRQRKRQGRQEEKVDAVGDEQPGLATGHQPDLSFECGFGGRRPGCCHLGRRRMPAGARETRGGRRRDRRSTWARTSDQSVVPIAGPISRGAPAKAMVPRRCEHHDLVAHIEVGERRRGCHTRDDDTADVGLAAQHRHHVSFLRGIQPGARLVDHAAGSAW